MIYFIQVQKGGPIKIGMAANPMHRLKQLQVANHEKLHLLKAISGGAVLEKKIHRDLKRFRRTGEWFEPSAEVLAYVRDVRSPDEQDYEIHDGLAYAVLWRDKERSLTDPCPFCGKRHQHGLTDGHRGIHCHKGSIMALSRDGTILLQERGYILRTRAEISSHV